MEEKLNYSYRTHRKRIVFDRDIIHRSYLFFIFYLKL